MIALYHQGIGMAEVKQKKKGSMRTGWHLNAIAMRGFRSNHPFMVGHIYRMDNANWERLGAQHLGLVLFGAVVF